MEKVEARILFSILSEVFLDVFEKFSYASKEEREKFFSDNTEFSSLYFLLVPLKSYVTDERGNTSNLPFEIFIDDNFYISHESNFITQASYQWMTKELIRDEFFVLGHSIYRLKLSEEDLRHLCWVLFCNVLDVRIKIWRKVKSWTILPKSDEKSDSKFQCYQVYLDFEKIEEGELNELKEQALYFDHIVDPSTWKELIDEISQTLKSTYFSIINIVATSATDNPNFLCDIHFHIDLERGRREELFRNTHREYDEYALTAFGKAKQHIFDRNKIELDKSVANNNITMRDQYNINQAGAVGPNSSSHSNTFNQTNHSLPDSFDYQHLSDEMSMIKRKLAEKASTPEDFLVLSEVARVEEASVQKDGSAVLKHLKAGGRLILETAKSVGASVIAEIISKNL